VLYIYIYMYIYIYIYIYDISSLRVKSFTTNKSIYIEPVQGLNLNCRYI